VKEQELIRKLQSVGKTIFVEYFPTFQSYSSRKISKEECLKILVSNGVSNESGAAIRCGNARLIFEAGVECDALRIIMASTHLPDKVLCSAQTLLKDLCK